MMGGSMGFGDIEEMVRCLWKRCRQYDRIICVCGNNKKQKRKLDKIYSGSSTVLTIGYSDRIPLLMDACDVLFTKPGGLTSTEALNQGIPIIHTAPIKGIEDKNAIFFNERGMSFTSPYSGDMAEYAFRLCEEENCRNEMLESQKHNRLGNAAQNILTIIKEMTQ
jgi:processive 1,2-diacylglycerol beta-glucosyltransferase